MLDAELCFPGADGGPDFGGLRSAFGAGRDGETNRVRIRPPALGRHGRRQGGTRETEPAVIHGALIAFEYGTTMKWLVTILAVVVGILGLAHVKNVDTSREALRVSAEARKALQHCEDTNRKAALEAPVPTFQSGTLRMIAVAPAPTFQDAQHKITVDALRSRAHGLAPAGSRKAGMWA